MNVEPEQCAAADFLATLREAFTGSAARAAFWLPTRPWGEVFGDPAPQALAAVRLIYRDRVALDLTGREYFVTRIGAAQRGGHENIARIDAALTWRIKGRHGVSIKYLGNFRNAFYPDAGDLTQHRATIGIFYTLLGNEHFGAVNWR